jgi:hypothetical protein
VTRPFLYPQLRKLALAAADAGAQLGVDAFGKVRALKDTTPPLCVKVAGAPRRVQRSRSGAAGYPDGLQARQRWTTSSCMARHAT